MKKLVLAFFWTLQYALGAGAILYAFIGPDVTWMVLLGASYGSTLLAGRLVGITPDLVQEASETVPEFAEILWRTTCKLVILILALEFFRHLIPYKIPILRPYALMAFYGAAFCRDVFLIRFYFCRAL